MYQLVVLDSENNAILEVQLVSEEDANKLEKFLEAFLGTDDFVVLTYELAG